MKNLLDRIISLQVLLGGLFLVGMIILTCSNILLREFDFPVRGVYEIMGFLGAVIFAFSLAYSAKKKEHLYVNILFDKFPERLKRFLGIISDFLCLAFFLMLSYQLLKKALILKDAGEVSETIRIVYYPFIFAVAFGILILALVLVYDFINKLGEKE
jgi:TRAP-type C4-dicarboxylate transport system permease small subunit